MDYYIKVNRRNVPVSEEIYKAWCKGERKERYFLEGDIHNGVFSYDALDTEDFNGCDLFSYAAQAPVEAVAEKRFLMKDLSKAIGTLNDDEKDLIKRLYYYEESLRKTAQEYHVPVSTLHSRHKKILNKLKNSIEHAFCSAD